MSNGFQRLHLTYAKADECAGAEDQRDADLKTEISLALLCKLSNPWRSCISSMIGSMIGGMIEGH